MELTGSRWKRRRLPDPQQFVVRFRTADSTEWTVAVQNGNSSAFADYPPRRGSFHPTEPTPDLPTATIPSTLFRSPNPLQIPVLLLLWHRHNSRSSNGSESIPPPKIHRPALTGPMYGVRWIYKIDPHYVGSHNFLLTPQLSGDGPPRLAGQRRARYPSASMRRSPVH